MGLFHHLTGKSLAAAATVLALVGCGDPVRDTPFLTGNTFDRYNDLAVVYPDSENVNISYEYGHVDVVDITVPGEFSGKGWLFSDNSAPLPERFVILQLLEPIVGATPEVGRELSIGKGVFTVKNYCVTLSGEDDPTVVLPYVNAVLGLDFALSDAVFIRRFVSKKVGLDGKRLDVAFVEDITRKGYDCGMLDNFDTDDENIQDFIEELKAKGDRSFEVVG